MHVWRDLKVTVRSTCFIVPNRLHAVARYLIPDSGVDSGTDSRSDAALELVDGDQ
jgi:hypothetical protein